MQTLQVTKEQAALLSRAQAAVDAANERLALVAGAITAGLVPDGSRIRGCDEETGLIQYEPPEPPGEAAP